MVKTKSKAPLLILVLTGAGIALSFFVLLLRNCPNFSRSQVCEHGQVETRAQQAQRIICIAPSITEIVFALGCGERVVGVSHFSTYPPEVKDKADIGGWINPNRERILALEPDLVITQGKHSTIARLCQDHGIRFLSVKIDSVNEITEAVVLLGQELGVEDRALKLAAKITAGLENVRQKTRLLSPRKVFISIGHTPGELSGLTTFNSGTFLNELIEIAGGVNIFADAPGSYPQISKESLVKRQPELIIELYPDGLSDKEQKTLLNDWDQLSMLQAVRSGRVYFLTEDYLMIPGVRIVQTAQRFAEIIHPEAFDENSTP